MNNQYGTEEETELLTEIVALQVQKDGEEGRRIGKSEDKVARKLCKKETKALLKISQQLGVQIKQEPTEWIVLWGPNVILGTSKEQVVNIFDVPPVEVRFYYNKSYCAVRFSSPSDAAQAKAAKSGSQLPDGQSMYIGFISDEPPEESRVLSNPFKTEWPFGLTLIKEFVSEVEENDILNDLVPGEDLDSSHIGKSLKRRWVRHFGYEFNYDTNGVNMAKSDNCSELPNSILPVVQRIVELNIVPRDPEQATMNHYLPGQGIPPHVDTHSVFEEPLLSLSLKADVVMDFRDGEKHCSVLLPRRSLLVLTDDARYQWTHSIANRTIDIVPDDKYGGITATHRQIRVSLTFRLLRSSRVCNCRFPFMCDSQKGKITEENASNLEDSLVHKVYEDIAPHFSQTRHTAWPKVKEFIEKLNPTDTLLDVGCGNGKYLNVRKYSVQGTIGTDMSSGLLDICREKEGTQVVRSNCLHLPFRDNSFDAVICIAVLHHLATKERRLRALNELMRVLKFDGEALIYVWAKNQELDDVKSSYAVKQEVGKNPTVVSSTPLTNYSFLPVHGHEGDFTHNDLLVPWVTGPSGSEVHHRFYHVFSQCELESLIHELEGRPKILNSYYDQGNWCILLQKI